MSTLPINQFSNERQFRRIAWGCFGFYALVAFIMNVVTVEKPKTDFTQMSPRLAQLLIQTKPIPPAVVETKIPEPKIEEKPKEEIKEEPKPVEEPAAKEKAKEEPKPVEVAKQEGPTPEQIRAEQEAQRKKNAEVAMNSGLLKLLKQAPSSKSVTNTRVQNAFAQVQGLAQKPDDKQASGISPIETANATKGIDEIVEKLEKQLVDSRPMIPERAVTGSGGIGDVLDAAKAASAESASGPSALKEHKTAAVESPFQVKGYEDGNLPRSLESIAEVVESYKGGTTFLYNKYLRENPALRGTVTVEFTIAAAGDILDCRVVSSTMEYTPFEEALVKRIFQWKFPTILAGNMTIIYPIIFSITG